MTIGVVTGMVSEAKLLEGWGYRVIAGGGHAQATRAKTERLVKEGVTALLSFGIAGALDAKLRPGDLIVANAVEIGDGRLIACDAAWRQRVMDKVDAIDGLVAGRSAAAATREEKAALSQASGAVAVDMESHHVAEIASRQGLPFLVIRAIADTADDSIPEAALVAPRSLARW